MPPHWSAPPPTAMLLQHIQFLYCILADLSSYCVSRSLCPRFLYQARVLPNLHSAPWQSKFLLCVLHGWHIYSCIFCRSVRCIIPSPRCCTAPGRWLCPHHITAPVLPLSPSPALQPNLDPWHWHMVGAFWANAFKGPRLVDKYFNFLSKAPMFLATIHYRDPPDRYCSGGWV